MVLCHLHGLQRQVSRAVITTTFLPRIILGSMRGFDCCPSTSRRRQTRSTAGVPVPEQGHRGAPPEYVSLGLCNRVCHHCKVLFWFEERLTHRSARFPEYHKCCMGGKVVLRPQGTKALKVHTTLLVDVSVQGTVAGFLKQSENFNKER